MRLENQQRICQCSGGGVVNGERDQGLLRNRRGRLVLRGGRVGLFKFKLTRMFDKDIPQDQEAGGIVRAVLDVLLEDINAMKICCETAGDSCAPLPCLLGDYLSAFRG